MRRLPLLFWLCIALFPVVASAQGLHSSKSMRFLFAMNVAGTTDPTMRQQLLQLREAGINVLTLSGTDATAYQQELPALETDSLFSRFKYVLMIGNIGSAWAADPTTVCNNAAKGILPQTVASTLDGVAAFGKQNAEYIVGYYTFDEPANQTPYVCKAYQELVYQRLRQNDPDIKDRPVIITNTLVNIYNNDAQIQASISLNAQDVMFVDQYQPTLAEQEEEYQAWYRNNLLSVMAPVFPAFSYSSCTDPTLRTSFRPLIQSALDAVYGANQPTVYGIAYFAFWPYRTDYKYDAQNCVPMFNSVIDDLQHDPTPVMSKIGPVLNMVLSN